MEAFLKDVKNRLSTLFAGLTTCNKNPSHTKGIEEGEPTWETNQKMVVQERGLKVRGRGSNPPPIKKGAPGQVN
ncbi:hypothetical protein AMTR_s00010p00241610 [Amborella trichopoda]|uniref:Uncharacterized protein n=1 Tax=Amborella trichopoda TaxID=13333 RepID=W1NFT9_AMBTC|nr:hypothetical protein AMTR_s00010p00241610 [Amborella trichopoda]